MENTNRQNPQGIKSYIQGSLCREITNTIINLKNQTTIKPEKPYHRGYYTGAFDMFHYGHLLGIQSALGFCDQLIVAVSTDEVIREYKHRDPIIPFEQRLAIVSSINGVSIAIPQYDLYNKMGPAEMLGCDVIFTSSEYLRSEYEGKEMTEKQKAGVERWERFESEAKEGGVDVVYLPRTNNVSSTEIKARIVDQYIIKKEEQETALPDDDFAQKIDFYLQQDTESIIPTPKLDTNNIINIANFPPPSMDNSFEP